MHFEEKPKNLDDPERDMMQIALASQWLASLWVVIEGWKELNFKDDSIDKSLNAYPDYCDILRRFRNATYHYQPNLFNDKIIDFAMEGSVIILWASILELEFQRFLWLWPEKFIGTRDEIREIREGLLHIIGWLPKEIIPAMKGELEKIKVRALEIIDTSEHMDPAIKKDILNEVEYIDNLIRATPNNLQVERLRELIDVKRKYN